MPRSPRRSLFSSRLWRLVILAVAALIALFFSLRLMATVHAPAVNLTSARAAGCTSAREAFQQHTSGQFITLSASVSRLLPDSVGTRIHQRFIVSCPSGQTVLITNDVSIGKRAAIFIGAHVVVRGQYIWNAQGGLIHFTHHDPSGAEGGWIYVGGKFYSLGQTGVPAIMMSSPSVS